MHTTLLKKAPQVGAFFVFICLAFPSWAFCPLYSGQSLLRVAKVVDGDTLRLADGRRVRLIGINTPERAHNGRPAEPFAEAATRRLQALVAASGGQVGLRAGKSARDHYGRTLAHVYGRDGHNLEARLLAEGLGYRVAFEPATGLEACQAEAEEHARRERQGLWQQTRVQGAFDLRRSGFALIHGKVEQVQRNRGGLWIELDGPLVLRIEPKLLRYFDVKAMQRLSGREVEARGWVVDRASRGGGRGQARWMLSLTHPDMLRRLP